MGAGTERQVMVREAIETEVGRALELRGICAGKRAGDQHLVTLPDVNAIHVRIANRSAIGVDERVCSQQLLECHRYEPDVVGEGLANVGVKREVVEELSDRIGGGVQRGDEQIPTDPEHFVSGKGTVTEARCSN